MNLVSREDCLAHHGIQGQKWGVRRYQNEDGTLTSAGKARLRNGGENKNTISTRIAEEKAKATAYKSRTDNIKKMSTSEIEQRISRLEKEKKLKDLEFQDTYPGIKSVTDILGASGSSAIRKVGAAAAIYGIKIGIEKAFGEDVATSIDKYIKKK